MAWFRIFLAFISGGTGCCLLTVALLRSWKRKQFRPGIEWAYGFFFLLAGLILWWRIPQSRNLDNIASKLPHKQVNRDQDLSSLQQRQENIQKAFDSLLQTKISSQDSSHERNSERKSNTTAVNSSHDRELPYSSKVIAPLLSRNTAHSNLAPEDRAYLLFAKSFDSIEDWFFIDEWSTNRTATQHIQSNMLVEGTADRDQWFPKTSVPFRSGLLRSLKQFSIQWKDWTSTLQSDLESAQR